MEISLGVVTAMPIKESIALTKKAEKVGYSRVWVGEDIFHRELFTYLAILTLNTEKLGLASGITSPYVRNHHVLASSEKAISRLSQGRFTLGLGTGGLPEVERLTGEPPKRPLWVMEKTIQLLRKKTDTQIFMGVRGPRMLDLAGRLADGVLLSGPKGYIKEAVEIVDQASKDREVKKFLWNAFYLGENTKLVSKITSVMLQSMPKFALNHMNKENPEAELCISGKKNTIKREIRGFERMGIDEFVIGPPYGRDPTRVIEEMVVGL
jgi:alkanesulfonate monooxygenase SsuD/methylene tetrahydromethanopterin reductase-like flavin-dependent oxidoreductase (luciferase family)